MLESLFFSPPYRCQISLFLDFSGNVGNAVFVLKLVMRFKFVSYTEYFFFLQFVCEGADLNKVKSKLETRNYTIEEAEVVYVPRGPIELEESEMEQISNIIEEVEETVPEVEKCFVNIA